MFIFSQILPQVPFLNVCMCIKMEQELALRGTINQ